MNILDFYGYNESPVGLVSTQSMQKAKDKEQDKLIQQIFSNPGAIGTGNPSTGGGGSSAGQQTNGVVNVEYLDLVELRDNGQLVPGQLYRITDYMTTTVEGGTRSAGHQFDVVVLALTTNNLSEDAWAVNHEFEDPDDDYFKDSNLSAWKIKYVLENMYWSAPSTGVTYATFEDTETGDISPEFRKFAIRTYEDETYIVWCYLNGVGFSLTKSTENASQAYLDDFSEEPLIIHSSRIDSENRGKGTIIYMKDEFNNECTYDFKNIQYKRYLVNGPDLTAFVLPEWYLNDPQDYGFDSYDYDTEFSFNGEDEHPIYRYCYTFSLQNDNGTDMYEDGIEVVNSWTIEDFSMNRYCYDNSLIYNNSMFDVQFGISEAVFIGDNFEYSFFLPNNILMVPSTDNYFYNNSLYKSTECTLFCDFMWNNDFNMCDTIMVKNGNDHTIKSSGSIFLEDCNNCTIDSGCNNFRWTNSNTHITSNVYGDVMYDNLIKNDTDLQNMSGTVYSGDDDYTYFITYSGSQINITKGDK